MKLLNITFLASLLFCVFISYSQAASKKTPPSYLFIETAKESHLDYDKTHKNYILVLNDVDNNVIYFSNGPKRITGIMPVNEFVKLFNDDLSKQKHKINAGLVAYTTDNNKTKRYTFTLKEINYDSERRAATFITSILPGTQGSSLNEHMDLKNSALFIDAKICASCGGSGM